MLHCLPQWHHGKALPCSLEEDLLQFYIRRTRICCSFSQRCLSSSVSEWSSADLPSSSLNLVPTGGPTAQAPCTLIMCLPNTTWRKKNIPRISASYLVYTLQGESKHFPSYHVQSLADFNPFHFLPLSSSLDRRYELQLSSYCHQTRTHIQELKLKCLLFCLYLQVSKFL